MKNIKLGPKLIASFLLIVALAAIVGIYLIGNAKVLAGQTNILYVKGAEPLGMLVRTAERTQEMRVLAWKWQRSKTAESRAAVEKELESAYNSSKELVKKQRDLVLVEEGIKIHDNLAAAIDKYWAEMQKYMKNSTVDANGTREETWPTVLAAADELTKALEATISRRIQSTRDISENATHLANTSQNVAFVVFIIVLVISLAISFFLTLSITGVLNTVVNTVAKLEKGDMTARFRIDRGDELGILTKALDNLSSRLQSIFRNINQDAVTLADSADGLSSVSSQMAAAAEENVVQSTSISITAEKATVNINAMASGAELAATNTSEVAAAAEQVSANMNTIVSAVEEMSANIGRISNNAQEASKVANQAVVNSATEVMSKLGSAAKEIGHVTEVIKKIADKTNLLALNATIEAASAGEAGKSFAVVASEIKELASQSAQSADDITRRVEDIQSGTVNAVNVIHNVSDIIVKINQSIEGISTYAGQQTKSSNEIVSSVAQANAATRRVAGAISELAKGSKDMARNASEAAKGAGLVNRGVAGIAQVAKDGVMGSRQIHSDADKLAKMASGLKGTMNQFRI